MMDKTSETKSDRPVNPLNCDTQQGDTINYRIVSQIASQDTGLLYRAVRNDDGSQIDVLVLRNLQSDEQERVRKRIALAKQLDHPAVARIIDADLKSDEQSCVLEPVPQRCLAEVVQESCDTEGRQLLSYCQQLASALAEGHRIGLVHGNLSPNSIHVRGDGSLQIDYLRPNTHRDTSAVRCEATDFFAPELQGVIQFQDAASDAFSLASVLMWIILGETAKPEAAFGEFRKRVIQCLPTSDFDLPEVDAFCQAIQDALATEPADRATAQELCDRLVRFAGNVLPSTPRHDVTASLGDQGSDALDATGQFDFSLQERRADRPHLGLGKKRMIGRFRVLKKLGEGGMGEVYEAEDTSDGQVVALKVLSRHIMSDRQAMRRFQKEARLLGEIRSPYVTNLIEVNQHHGQHYIVMDYVSGFDLRKMIRRTAPFQEPVALSVIADVARGLASAHQRDIIHRDIKPANILLAYDPQDERDDLKSAKLDLDSLKQFRVKLSDFGLARQVDQTESMQMTREGGSIGTPMYMSPEQFSSGRVSPATDVYSLGITLYEMLAGNPPFTASDITQLINKHCRESPTPLQRINGEISEATCEIVQRAMAKDPQDRYSDAGQFLRDIERVLRGECRNVESHPQVPSYQSGDIFEEVFEWKLDGDAAELWPYVSNTERINNAVGVPSVVYHTKRDDQGRLRKYGTFRLAGLQIAWEEHPFEWIEGQRLGILREFNQGPFVWFLSIVELIPQLEGGTLLRHTVRILPRGLIGRAVATMEVRVKGKRNLDRVYRRIDHAVTGSLGSSTTVDPFRKSSKLSSAKRHLLDQRLDRLAESGTDPVIVDCLGRFLSEAPAQELGRIRPVALARNFGVDSNQMIVGCLEAAREGLVDLHWDILCPTCRISSQVTDTLNDVEDHARCEVCDLDFEVDLAKSVEMVFRVNPELRKADLGTYCIGGPEHSPHVVFQLRLPPGERLELSPTLSEGEYVLRSAQLTYNYQIRALPGKGSSHTEIVFAANPDSERSSQVRAGRNVLTLTNDHERDVVVRLERRIPMRDVVTAAQASSMSMFREMFPDESPKFGQLIHVSTVTLLAIELGNADQMYQDLDDVSAYSCVRQFHGALEELATKQDGCVVNVMATEALLSFETPENVIDFVLELVRKLAPAERELQFKAAIHRGTALATSTNRHLDYFGSSVHLVRRVMQRAQAYEVWVTEAVAADPMVAQVINRRNLRTEFIDLGEFGRSGMRCQRVNLM